MAIITIDNEDLLNQAESILDNVGMDVSSAVKVFLKRLVNEKSIIFLFDDKKRDNVVISEEDKKTDIVTESFNPPIIETRMTKTIAISLFRSKGYSYYLRGNITFASSNSTVKNYWANPNFEVLRDDWTIILNNIDKCELYLFYIPKDSLQKNVLLGRADKDNIIDLQIMYNDPSFTDIRSKFVFVDYLITKIRYSSDELSNIFNAERRATYFGEMFTVTNEKEIMRSKRGYKAYNSEKECVGIVFMTDDKRISSYGNCELCFYPEYRRRYGEWHRIRSYGKAIRFSDLEKILSEKTSYSFYID